MKKLALLMVIASLGVAAPAFADVAPPPPQNTCQGKDAGTPCTTTDGKAGQCGGSTCFQVISDDAGGSSGTSGTSGTTSGGTSGTGTVSDSHPTNTCSVGAGDAGSLLVALAAFVPLMIRRRRKA